MNLVWLAVIVVLERDQTRGRGILIYITVLTFAELPVEVMCDFIYAVHRN